MSCKIRKGPRNDNIDFKALLKDLKIRYVVADKGYDSKQNRKYVLKKDAYPCIPYRKTSGSTYEKIGRKIKFDKRIYNQRSKVETVFSVIKRKYGSVVKGKSFESQKKEIICKLIAYNIDRKIRFVLLIGFQQSLFLYLLYLIAMPI